MRAYQLVIGQWPFRPLSYKKAETCRQPYQQHLLRLILYFGGEGGKVASPSFPVLRLLLNSCSAVTCSMWTPGKHILDRTGHWQVCRVQGKLGICHLKYVIVYTEHAVHMSLSVLYLCDVYTSLSVLFALYTCHCQCSTSVMCTLHCQCCVHSILVIISTVHMSLSVLYLWCVHFTVSAVLARYLLLSELSTCHCQCCISVMCTLHCQCCCRSILVIISASTCHCQCCISVYTSLSVLCALYICHYQCCRHVKRKTEYSSFSVLFSVYFYCRCCTMLWLMLVLCILVLVNVVYLSLPMMYAYRSHFCDSHWCVPVIVVAKRVNVSTVYMVMSVLYARHC